MVARLGGHCVPVYYLLGFVNFGHSLAVRACSRVHRLLFAVKAFQQYSEFQLQQVMSQTPISFIEIQNPKRVKHL